VKENRALMLKN